LAHARLATAMPSGKLLRAEIKKLPVLKGILIGYLNLHHLRESGYFCFLLRTGQNFRQRENCE
jgi:hypothetical protein